MIVANFMGIDTYRNVVLPISDSTSHLHPPRLERWKGGETYKTCTEELVLNQV